MNVHSLRRFLRIAAVTLVLLGCDEQKESREVTEDVTEDVPFQGACTVADNNNGTATISCPDGTTVTIQNGVDGQDGALCSVTDNGDGSKTIACDDGTSVDIVDGSAGVDGNACSVTDHGDGTKTIDCDDGTTVDIADGAPGVDGASCSVTDNGDRTQTIVCTDGTMVTITDGQPGTDGADGLNVEVLSWHGTEYLFSSGEYLEGRNGGPPKYFADLEITSASADAEGVVRVDFTIADAEGEPVVGNTDADFNIAKLMPASGSESYNKWAGYIFRVRSSNGVDAEQASRENSGVLTDHGDGSYTYVFETNLLSATKPVSGTPVTFDRTLTHRVSVMLGGHAGPTADASFDFVPNGSAITETRDIVRTEACVACHGPDFHGHGGDRLSVSNCVTCHTEDTWDAASGDYVDMMLMTHKIHAGAELASTPGPDGLVWDDPETIADETEDNGRPYLNGNWWKVGFPAVIENCEKCHQGAGVDVDNWKTVPSRRACGSCHDTTSFVNPPPAGFTLHRGGEVLKDGECAICHRAEVSAAGNPSVVDAHDFMRHDPRNISEFQVEMTVSTPDNGAYFMAGETPVVSIVLTDVETGQVIDHTSVVQDTDGSEGCTLEGCPPRDGAFRSFALYVHGPRAKRVPVLSTSAQVKVNGLAADHFDLSAEGASLDLVVDHGQSVLAFDASGGEFLVDAEISVDVPSIGSEAQRQLFPDGLEFAMPQQVVDWLNADHDFTLRAIAYLETGGVAVRSRNLGRFFSLQLLPSTVNTQVFGGNTDVHFMDQSTVSNQIYQYTNSADNDPKASWSTGAVRYTLDPVDDLVPGTYVASVEIADRHRLNTSNYKTPSVAKVTFQVKQADEEPLVAANCDACHQGPDGPNDEYRGFILDNYRHHKMFTHDAMDGCGACHDYLARGSGAASPWSGWTGARPISKRVHAIHFGSELSFPLATVDYSNGDPVSGRNWDITYPQDVRFCESCHTEQTSDTWKEAASRLPCAGCHDSDAARAHILLMTWDPTPDDPWSGDEEESCKSCH